MVHLLVIRLFFFVAAFSIIAQPMISAQDLNPADRTLVEFGAEQGLLWDSWRDQLSTLGDDSAQTEHNVTAISKEIEKRTQTFRNQIENENFTALKNRISELLAEIDCARDLQSCEERNSLQRQLMNLLSQRMNIAESALSTDCEPTEPAVSQRSRELISQINAPENRRLLENLAGVPDADAATRMDQISAKTSEFESALMEIQDAASNANDCLISLMEKAVLLKDAISDINANNEEVRQVEVDLLDLRSRLIGAMEEKIESKLKQIFEIAEHFGQIANEQNSLNQDLKQIDAKFSGLLKASSELSKLKSDNKKLDERVSLLKQRITEDNIDPDAWKRLKQLYQEYRATSKQIKNRFKQIATETRNLQLIQTNVRTANQNSQHQSRHFSKYKELITSSHSFAGKAFQTIQTIQTTADSSSVEALSSFCIALRQWKDELSTHADSAQSQCEMSSRSTLESAMESLKMSKLRKAVKQASRMLNANRHKVLEMYQTAAGSQLTLFPNTDSDLVPDGALILKKNSTVDYSVRKFESLNQTIESLEEELRLAKLEFANDDARIRFNLAKQSFTDRKKNEQLNRLAAAYEQDLVVPNSPRKTAHQSAKLKRVVHFDSAAHFPYRIFDQDGVAYDKAGVIIYENMSFSFDEDGNYEVAFQASGPNMPVRLAIKLHFNAHSENGVPITLTLPHQHLSGWENDIQKVQVINIAGQSTFLKKNFSNRDLTTSIKRTGSARFGHGKRGLGQISMHLN